MNIADRSQYLGQAVVPAALNEPPRKRPVRMIRWFIIIGLGLALIVGALVGFNAFRGKMIEQFFADNKPPPAAVTVAEAKSEVIPNLLTAVGDLAAVHQVNVTSDVNGRITEILFQAGAEREGGHAAGAVVRRTGAGRSRQLQGAGDDGAALARSRQAAGRAPVRAAGRPSTRPSRRSTRPMPASPRPRPSSRRSWCARRSTASSASARSRSGNI